MKSVHAKASALTVDQDCWSSVNGEQEAVFEISKHLLVECRIFHVAGIDSTSKGGGVH